MLFNIVYQLVSGQRYERPGDDDENYLSNIDSFERGRDPRVATPIMHNRPCWCPTYMKVRNEGFHKSQTGACMQT